MICRPGNRPRSGQDIDAMVCWFSDQPLSMSTTYTVKHTTRSVRGRIQHLRYRLDTDSLHRDETADQIGDERDRPITLRTTQPLFYDSYNRCRATGSFILVNEASHETAGCGMMLGPAG